jgi:hypothetical protein
MISVLYNASPTQSLDASIDLASRGAARYQICPCKSLVRGLWKTLMADFDQFIFQGIHGPYAIVLLPQPPPSFQQVCSPQVSKPQTVGPSYLIAEAQEFGKALGST